MDFGNKLRVLIEEQGVTQKELANKLNISPSTLFLRYNTLPHEYITL